MKKLLVFSFWLLSLSARAQQQPYSFELPKGLVILQSTHDYAAALAGAKQAAAQLHQPLKLDGRKPNKALGLSADSALCKNSGCAYPCYWPRGQDMTETSDYISIEFSASFQGLAKGYYIVVAASGPPNSATLRQALERVRRVYPTAYAKRTAVGFGCVH
jgi:hypothetical protein